MIAPNPRSRIGLRLFYREAEGESSKTNTDPIAAETEVPDPEAPAPVAATHVGQDAVEEAPDAKLEEALAGDTLKSTADNLSVVIGENSNMSKIKTGSDGEFFFTFWTGRHTTRRPARLGATQQCASQRYWREPRFCGHASNIGDGVAEFRKGILESRVAWRGARARL